MNLSFVKNKIVFIFIFAIVFTIIFFLSLFQLNPLIDTGREFYLPYRVLSGDVLYRDIFNIYGPFAYQLNAFAYKILGTNINALRIFGSANATLILVSVFFILKEFFDGKNKENYFNVFVFLLCPLFLGIFYTGTFNYSVPYAFAMTYGLCFFLFSVLFFIKSVKSDNNNFLFLSSLLAGGAVTCKYEFAAYLLFLLFYSAFAQKNNRKIFLISVFASSVIPVISFGTLFLQGMSVDNLVRTLEIQRRMAETDAINYLYSHYSGTYFSLKIFKFCLLKTVLLFLPLTVLFFADKFYSDDKILYPTTVIFAVFGVIYTGFVGFSLFAILHFLLFLCFIKKIFKNKPLFVFMFSVVLLSFKTFFAVNYDVYGTYILPFLIISFGLFINSTDFVKDEKEIKRFKKIFLTAVILPLFIMSAGRTVIEIYAKSEGAIITETVNNTDNFFEKTKKTVFTHKILARTFNETLDFINKNTSENDVIVVLPETQFVNFVSERPADNLFDSLTPLYFETFGEENIIAHFKETKPEYFILNNRDTSDYGKKYICDNYGQNFCKFIRKDYEKIKEIGENKYMLKIYKRTESK